VQHAEQPLQVAQIGRLIEPELGAENLQRLGRRLLAEHRGGDVSRQNLGADENQHRHRQEGEQTQGEPRRNQS
jgi:hypothetical protein